MEAIVKALEKAAHHRLTCTFPIKPAKERMEAMEIQIQGWVLEGTGGEGLTGCTLR